MPSWSVAIQLFRSRPGTTEILLDTLLLETTPLPPYGSCRQVIELDSLSGGIWQVLARVDFALDGDPSDNEATSVIRVGYPAGGVVINEVMYYPASEAPEWLEIYNLTRNEIDLNGWLMRKAKGSWLTLCDQTFILLPNEYLVVAANPNLGQFYPDFTARYLCPASFPLLSNTGDSLFLCDAVGKVQESIYYSAYWGGKLNVSVERINPYQPAVTANNWGSAQAPAGATPGGINSIARRTFDLKIDSVYTSLNYCRQGEDITACVTVSNYGLEPFSGGKIQLQVKSAHPERLVSAAEVPLPSDLLPDRQLTLSCPILSIAGGVYQIVASIIAEHDQNAANNRDSCSLSVGYSPGQVYITEILYKPATGEAEWFELYNAGSDTLNLQGWQLRTALDNWKLLTDSTIFLLPRDFLVIAAQDKFLLRYPDFKGRYIIPPTFPSLNNTSDSLILRDAAQLIADVAYYRDLLGSKSDISIEKSFKINRNLLQDYLVKQGVLPAIQSIAEIVGMPTIMVLPEKIDNRPPLELLRTEPNLKKGAEVIESFLTARQYTVIVPEQQQALQEMQAANFSLSGESEDYSYLLALAIGSDIYINYNIKIESRKVGSATVKKGIVGCRAYETTTARLLGTETGFSPERPGADAVVIEEAMNDAISKVLDRVNNYWKTDLLRGIQYKLVVNINQSIDSQTAEGIIDYWADLVKKVAQNYKENAVADYTYDVLLWCDPASYRSSSELYRYLRQNYKGYGTLQKVSLNRKLILLNIIEQ